MKLVLNYGKIKKIKEIGLNCKTWRKYLANPYFSTIFILVFKKN
jgi:hypothetical protein